METFIENTADVFRDELNPGERIYWSGQPQQGLLLRPGDIFLIPFSLMWGGFAIFWESMAVAGGAPFLFALWGVPFVLIGLYMIAGRFIYDIFQRQITYYALTDERVIIISGLYNRNVKSIQLKNLSEVNLLMKSDGRGTITFGATPPMAWLSSGSGWPTSSRYPLPPSFERVEDARSIYQLLKRLQKEID